jgi:hypothetical protein
VSFQNKIRGNTNLDRRYHHHIFPAEQQKWIVLNDNYKNKYVHHAVIECKNLEHADCEAKRRNRCWNLKDVIEDASNTV